jgi:hypothetical protein
MTHLRLWVKPYGADVLIYTSQPDPGSGHSDEDTIKLLSVEEAETLIADIHRALPKARKVAMEKAGKDLIEAREKVRDAQQSLESCKAYVSSLERKTKLPKERVT